MGRSWIYCCTLGGAFDCWLQQSTRLACLKLRMPQGKLAIISAYAPFGYPFDERQRFFEDLGTMCRKTSVNWLKYVFGDVNSRIHRQVPGEETVIGEHAFGDPSAELGLGSNNELLLEVCARPRNREHFLPQSS